MDSTAQRSQAPARQRDKAQERTKDRVTARAASKKAMTQTSEPGAQSNRRRNPNKPYNDIDLSQWKDYDHVLTDSLWMMESRTKRDGHQLDYHGNFIPQIANQMMLRYTKAGDTILDYFLGSGTTAIEAHNLGRKCIGVELQSRMADYVQTKLSELGACETSQVIVGDSADLQWTGGKISQALRAWEQEAGQFAFLHPPYDDIIKFSENEQCLSNAESTEAFLDGFERVCQQAYNFLEKGRFACLVIGDKYANSELIPLGFYCMERMMRVGFKNKSIVVKNMTGNEKGKGKTANLWRYRALAGGFYIFKHEYVMVFQK